MAPELNFPFKYPLTKLLSQVPPSAESYVTFASMTHFGKKNQANPRYGRSRPWFSHMLALKTRI